MLARKNSFYHGKSLEKIESLIRDVLNEEFPAISESKEVNETTTFPFSEPICKVFENELLLIVSKKLKSYQQMHTTFFLSADLQNNQSSESSLKKMLGHLIEGLIALELEFSNCHEDNYLDFYSLHWSDIKIGQDTYFYRISREDIKATLKADELLKDFPELILN